MERLAEDPAVELAPSRRRALARLGLAAAVAYAAPVITTLDRSAKAQILPSCENPPPLPPGPCNSEPASGGEPAPFTGEPQQ